MPNPKKSSSPSGFMAKWGTFLYKIAESKDDQRLIELLRNPNWMTNPTPENSQNAQYILNILPSEIQPDALEYLHGMGFDLGDKVLIVEEGGKAKPPIVYSRTFTIKDYRQAIDGQVRAFEQKLNGEYQQKERALAEREMQVEADTSELEKAKRGLEIETSELDRIRKEIEAQQADLAKKDEDVRTKAAALQKVSAEFNARKQKMAEIEAAAERFEIEANTYKGRLEEGKKETNRLREVEGDYKRLLAGIITNTDVPMTVETAEQELAKIRKAAQDYDNLVRNIKAASPKQAEVLVTKIKRGQFD
jgi:uncharacterized protein YPO0396